MKHFVLNGRNERAGLIKIKKNNAEFLDTRPKDQKIIVESN